MIAKESTSMLVKLADFFISGDKHTSCCSCLFLSSSGFSGAAGLVTACGSLEGFWRLILALSSLSLIGKVGTLFHLFRCSLGTLGRSFSPKNVLLGMVQATPATTHTPNNPPFWAICFIIRRYDVFCCVVCRKLNENDNIECRVRLLVVNDII